MIDPPPLSYGKLDSVTTYSDNFLDRLFLAFEDADSGPGDHDIWSEISGHSADFVRALRVKDRAIVRQMLAEMFQSNLLLGMAHSSILTTDKSPYGKAYFGMRVRDSLLALAEMLAIKGVESHHQTSFSDHVALTNGDLSYLIPEIESRLGHPITAPDAGQPAITRMGAHALNPDFLRHAYAMYRLENLGFKKSGPILEIGGGFGAVARYGHLRGFTDITIIDLPFANAVQAGFLAATLGEDVVRFHNEPESEDKATVTVWPSTRKEYLPDEFMLAINMDSLPEINATEAQAYLDLIAQRSDAFWSVNQEAEKQTKGGMKQNRVSAMADAMAEFHRQHRHPYWMEQGYVEELFEIVRN